MLNFSHKQTTAYHPELISAVFRLHRRLKDALRASDSERSRGKTLVCPQLRQFSVHKLLPNKFLHNDELLVDTIVKKSSKTCFCSFFA
jgi:hypothetical protein